MSNPNTHKTRLRIAVGGLAVTFPFGGMFWHYIQFVLGLHRLGHDVLYVEDVGRWCYEPTRRTFVKDGSRNAQRFEENLAKLKVEQNINWFYRDATGKSYGMDARAARNFCKEADIFVNVSLSHDVLRQYGDATCTVLVDTDPLYTQAVLGLQENTPLDEDEARVIEMLDRHDAFFTYGLNVGQPDCLVPHKPYEWHPMVQPMAADQFEAAHVPVSQRREVFTTIASWEPHEALTRVGDRFYSGKSSEFDRIMTLPQRSSVPLELALSGEPPVEELLNEGWRVVDGYQVSADPWRFQSYMAESTGEFSVAKQAYVSSRSGWFSDRSACYLALGVPVILQDTGFGHVLPTGEGLLSFSTLDEAAAAIESVLSAPDAHAKAAQEISDQHFRAEKVMGNILEIVSAHV